MKIYNRNCPICNSTDITKESDCELKLLYVVNLKCRSCKSRWNNIFPMGNYEIVYNSRPKTEESLIDMHKDIMNLGRKPVLIEIDPDKGLVGTINEYLNQSSLPKGGVIEEK